MPARAWVELDCRILPGTTEADVEREVRARLGDGLRYELELAGAPDRGQLLAGRRAGPRRHPRRSSPTRGSRSTCSRPWARASPTRSTCARRPARRRTASPRSSARRSTCSPPATTTRTSASTSTTCCCRPASTSTSRSGCSGEGPRAGDHGRVAAARRAQRDHRRRRASGSATPPSSRATPRGPASRWSCRTTANVWADGVYAGHHRLNGNGEMTGLPWLEEVGPAALPDRADQHPQRRRGARRPGRPRGRASDPTASRPGRSRWSPRPGTATSTTSTASTSPRRTRGRRTSRRSRRPGRRGLGRRRHRDDLPRVQGRHRHRLAPGAGRHRHGRAGPSASSCRPTTAGASGSR